jgi:hypothetical protein
MYLLQNLCILVSAAAATCLVLLMGGQGPDAINRLVSDSVSRLGLCWRGP